MLGAAAAYWSLVIAEGAYFGPRVVSALYDRSATGYDTLKDVPLGWDEERLAEPLLARLVVGKGQAQGGRASLVLDLATGTGRLPVALLADPAFEGTVIGLDLSGAMLQVAWRKVGGWSPRSQLVRAPVVPAPFADGAFSAVTMLEALEFTPRPRETLAEMARLLAPGGTLVVTNRIGWEARLLPRRAMGADDLVRSLDESGFVRVTRESWQTHYDLIWASKPGTPVPAGSWTDAIRCVHCARQLTQRGNVLACGSCGSEVPWRDGFWDVTLAVPNGVRVAGGRAGS